MKKIKTLLVSCAVLFALSTAVATTNKCVTCEYSQQYRLLNGSYVPAGQLGIDYICTDQSGTCTFYKPWPTSDYIPCQTGTYMSLY